MANPTPVEQAYLDRVERTGARRRRWWKEARFGMFIHWGLYSQLGRNEWAMNLERIPVPEYEKLAATWKPKPRCMREWAALAKRAGMKYMVMTTKHHEGFCLWDTKMTDYNAVQRGPRRDLVREYVEAAREVGLKVGLYYSLMDWHHPDGIRCAKEEAARQRFVNFTRGCVRELMSHYGKIDILWYDVSWPLTSPQAWDSYRLNAMVRELQPHILINDRAQIPEDFGTPEEHIKPAAGDRAWEACMTFNGSWGWQPTPPEDWLSSRKVLDMLRTCTANGGNLLLNIGPHPDGTVPREAVERLTAVGQWLKTYGGVVYGPVDRAGALTSGMGNWTRKGRQYYFWCSRWPGRELAIGALTWKLRGARLYPSDKKLSFTQTADRLVIQGLPEKCPDKTNHVGVVELTFRTPPIQLFNAGPVSPDVPLVDLSGKWVSPQVDAWKVSRLLPKKGDVIRAGGVQLSDKLGWKSVRASQPEGFISVHDLFGDKDGLVYIGNVFRTPGSGVWRLHLGHDGGAKVFVDGRVALTVPSLINPAVPGRSKVDLRLSKGDHEIVIAFDTAGGRGWGIFACFEIPQRQRGKIKPVFPKPVMAWLAR
ncbi:MAG: hypothetical protein PCFJNLEI_00644 [Verrucomicrobiae bacterium]|nr:hypothetical protein [Verrucomicrobiae bacterium]